MSTHTHTHTHTHVGFYGLRGLSIGVMVFILYKLYVLLPYTYPTPKLSPHRRRCISTFPQKNSLCMIYTHFELWGHWKCPHKSPSPCNTYVIPMSFIQMCFLINHINTRAHTHTHTHTHKQNVYRCCTEFNFDSVIFISNTIFRGWDFIHRQLIRLWLLLVVVLFIKVIFN